MIESFIEKAHTISIYGTGNMAHQLFDLLDVQIQDKVSCFVVTDGYLQTDVFCGKPVKEISQYAPKNDEALIVAVQDIRNRSEIEGLLGTKGFEYITLDDSDFKKLYRIKNKVIASSFISTTQPVSRLFGIDRGGAIDRYYIVNFLKDQRAGLNDVRKTLEVGEASYSELLFPSAKHDVLDFSLGMDLTDTDSLPENEYDCFICTQTLNFIYDVKAAIKGCYSLLSYDGTLLATVAGNISQVSKYDMDRWGDYWRFTYRSIDMLVREVFGNDVKVYPFGNSMAATAFIQGLCIEDIDTSLLDVRDPEYSIVIGIVAKKKG